MRDLSRGDRGKEVLDVQTRLRGRGFELGREGEDGFFGPSTELAVRSFQQERGLVVDGIVGANSWRELVEAGYALGDRLLYLRVPPFRGDDVLALQVKLNLLGFNAGAERGVHDAEVERAVIDFQRNAGLPLDGIVGESTLVKLEAVRKAESGREGKKIPERDGGFVPARSLVGQTVVIDLDSRAFGIEKGEWKYLPQDCLISIMDPLAGEIIRGRYPIVFQPAGGMGGGTIVLSRGKKVIRIELDPITGAAMIRKGA